MIMIHLAALAATPTAPPDSAILEMQNRKIIVYRAPIGASGPQERVTAAARQLRLAVARVPGQWLHRASVRGEHPPDLQPAALLIQDAFNEAGIEIMSPSYFALRDGNSAAIPEEQRPKRRPPTFRVDVNPE